MKILPTKISIKPNTIGFLYRDNRLAGRLEPGVYRIWEFWTEIIVIVLPTTLQMQEVVGQEVLTKDNIAFRFSYFIEFRIFDGEKFLARFGAFLNQIRQSSYAQNYSILHGVNQSLHNFSQIYLRNSIAEITSEEINEKRDEILAKIPEKLGARFAEHGVEIENLVLRDVTFPKSIQNLFAKQLEAKIRAKADLENARTTVAAARALKNAAELMKDDENVKFLQMLETITKIADKGKHTFIIGDVSQNAPLRK